MKRVGLNRLPLWQSKEFAGLVGGYGEGFLPASIASLESDTDVRWRPRLPQWPAVGETMATAIQSALVGQAPAKQALDEAQARIAPMLKG